MKQRTMSRKLAPAIFGVVAALAAPLMLAAPANAAESNCSTGQTCIWRDASFVTNGSGSSLRGFSEYIPDYSGWTYAGTTINAGNNALSVYNNGNAQSVRIYSGTNKGGSYFQLAIKTGDGNISNSSGYVQGKSWRPNSGYFSKYW